MLNTYDEVPYPVYSHSSTHPANMATLAMLHGLEPAPVEHCRVLELGSASGGNIIPMAMGLPQSEFVGIDSSVRQVATGHAYAAALGLKNLNLHHMDVQQLDDGLGQFDYIICHGLYAWVPGDRQEKILEVCQRNLSPNGVAFVSYNTLPGWRTLSVIRDMLLYHTRGTTDTQNRTARARSLISFLAQSHTGNRTPTGGLVQAYADFFQAELASLGAAHDSYLLHEMLEEVNDPIYFSEFVERARRHNLQYLTEVEFRATLASNLDPALAQGVMNMARDVVEWEQYIDFVKGRTFRQTLLCHADQKVSRTMKPEALTRFYVASSARPTGPVDLDSVAVQDFGDPETLALATDHAITKAAMIYLNERWPLFVSFQKLFAEARTRVGRTGETHERDALDVRVLCDNLFTAFSYSTQLVELSAFAPCFARTASERPVASPWARLQAQDGFTVTNMRHERLDLNAVHAHVLRYLDGTRNRDEVLEAIMVGPVAGGKMIVRQGETPVQDPNQIREILRPEVDQGFEQLAASALLIA
jgi:methyltransferase-like protein/2-polyprenyl-3-methyl-5-hydroxy-6-metoxy-1,4-benzoquinol methylase